MLSENILTSKIKPCKGILFSFGGVSGKM